MSLKTQGCTLKTEHHEENDANYEKATVRNNYFLG